MINKLISKYKKTSTLVKASMWFTVANIVQKGIQFAVVPIYTRVLPIQEYGVYTLFQTWLNILIIFVTLNLVSSVVDKGMMKYEHDRDRFISSMQGLGILVSVLFFVIFLLFRDNIIRLTGLSNCIFLAMFVYFLVYPSYGFWSIREKYERRYKPLLFSTLLIAFLTPLLSIFFIVYFGKDSKALVWGYVISQAIVGIPILIYQFKVGRKICIMKYWSYAIRFCIPLIPHFLATFILAQSDRIMIDDICGRNFAAIYGLANSIALLANVVIGAINQTIIPYTYEKLENKQYNSLNSVTYAVTVIIILLSFYIVLFGPEVVFVMGSNSYYSAKWVIPPLVMSNVVFFVIGRLTNVEYHYEKTIFTMIISTVSAVLNVLLNVTMIPKYGFVAAGYTTLASYMFMLILHCIYIRILCNKLGQREPFDEKIYFYLLGIAFGFTGICIALYSVKFIFRVIFFVLSILLILFKRKRLKEYLRCLYLV